MTRKTSACACPRQRQFCPLDIFKLRLVGFARTDPTAIEVARKHHSMCYSKLASSHLPLLPLQMLPLLVPGARVVGGAAVIKQPNPAKVLGCRKQQVLGPQSPCSQDAQEEGQFCGRALQRRSEGPSAKPATANVDTSPKKAAG